MPRDTTGADPARIGPNAVIQVGSALHILAGPEVSARVFEAAGLSDWLARPPEAMVPEAEVARLHATLWHLVPQAAEVAALAGRLTGDYLLANRIPALVQRLLGAMPPRLAARVLLGAIGRHAWTFAGLGRFSARPGHPVVVRIADNPLCLHHAGPGEPCLYHAQVFERLFQRLVHSNAAARVSGCCCHGDPACEIVLDW